MIELVMTLVVVLGLAGVVAALSVTFPRAIRPWVWLAFGEYLLCAGAQLFYSRAIVGGGDTLRYAEVGADLAKFLDAQFSWASREMLAMLLQQTSVFDTLIDSPQSNTSSMYAVVAWLVFFLGGSTYAAHVLVSGLAFLGALSIYRACARAYPEVPPRRLFVATVMFPSVAFWTAALHKEAFGLIGIGLVLAAWNAAYRRKLFRALVYAPLGLIVILLFRAPAVPPLLLGLVIYVAVERLQRTRGADTVLLGPAYLALGLGALALTMVAVTRFVPSLALDQLSETVELKQQGWALSRGGSSFESGDAGLPQSFSAQLLRIPLALVNALFRPQLFDVNNIAALVSAIEMTAITWMILRIARHHGIGGVLVRIQKSPFLLMCTVITVVGCTFVGLVTLNFGSLARYRVPFLPFYGALVVALSPVTAKARVPARPARRPRRTHENAIERPAHVGRSTVPPRAL